MRFPISAERLPPMRLTLLICAFVFALAGCSVSADTTAAEAEVPKFHALLDAAQFTAIYAAAGADLKKAATEQDFVALLSAIHRKLGTLKTSTRHSWNVNVNGDGRFVTLTYATEYEGGQATEQFVYRMDEKTATLSGYNINSLALILK